MAPVGFPPRHGRFWRLGQRTGCGGIARRSPLISLCLNWNKIQLHAARQRRESKATTKMHGRGRQIPPSSLVLLMGSTAPCIRKYSFQWFPPILRCYCWCISSTGTSKMWDDECILFLSCNQGAPPRQQPVVGLRSAITVRGTKRKRSRALSCP